MAVQKLGYPRMIGIHPSADRKLFRFHLEFHERAQSQQAAVEFEMSAAHAMVIMRALQDLQRRHNIPTPPPSRPKGGRPILRLVKSDDPA
jgi:hypothetical protein